MTGNEADVTLGDVIGLLVDDPQTEVIVVYSEGIRDGERFVAALEAARRARKPVAMMKVGASRLGGEAARSHTASIAGDDRVAEAVLADLGVCRARSTEHLLDVARLAARRVYPAGNTLGVITVSGGAGVIVADAAEAEGLPMPPMPQSAQDELKALIPFCAPRNPVDCTAQVLNDPAVIGRFLEATIGAGGYRSVLGFFTYTGGSDSLGAQIRREMKAALRRHRDRLLVASVLATPAQVRAFEDDGISVFEDPGAPWRQSPRWGGSAMLSHGPAGRPRRSRATCHHCPRRRPTKPRPWTCWPRLASPPLRSASARQPMRRSPRRADSVTRWC